MAFEPVPSRNLPDVEGVLWLDESSAELQTLEYRYANHPYDLRDGRIGGTVAFMPVPSGAWIVHRWEIRVPTLDVRTSYPTPVIRRDEVVVAGFNEMGGEVLTITDGQGAGMYQAPMAVVRGSVVDTTGGESTPLVGAVVQIAGAWFADVTDSEGRFSLSAPLDGEYGVIYTHPTLDSLGFQATPQMIDLARGRVDSLSLVVASLDEIASSLCPDDFRGPDHRS